MKYSALEQVFTLQNKIVSFNKTKMIYSCVTRMISLQCSHLILSICERQAPKLVHNI